MRTRPAVSPRPAAAAALLCRGLLLLLLAAVSSGARATILHVPADYATIQSAIDAASDGDGVELENGTYTGPGNVELDFLGKSVFVYSASDNPAACVIDCQGTTYAADFVSGEDDNAGFVSVTIQNAQSKTSGGAVLIDLSDPTFMNCVFKDCAVVIDAGSDAVGGAVLCIQGAPTFYSCTFRGNTAVAGGGRSAGGGAYFGASDNTYFIQCLFQNNTATGSDGDTTVKPGFAAGGAIVCEDSLPLLGACVFLGNTAKGGDSPDTAADANGGAVAMYDVEGLIASCVFSGNRALGGHSDSEAGFGLGGAILQQHIFSSIINCSFAGNSALGDNGADATQGLGGAVFQYDDYGSYLWNSIFWGDTSSDGYPELYVDNPANTNVGVCDVQGGFADGVVDILNTDPLFVRAPFTNGPDDYGDLHLQAGSPLIDAGDDSAVAFFGIPVDADGSARIHGAHVDIGGYEYGNYPPVADAGPDQHINSRLNVPVTLDGSASYDPDGDKITYSWTEGGSVIGTGVSPTVHLDPGIHTITLTVTDPSGASSSDDVVITVDPRAVTTSTIAPTGIIMKRGQTKAVNIHLKSGRKQLMGKTQTVYLDDVVIGTVSSANPAKFNIFAAKSLDLGVHQLKVRFDGDIEYQPSEALGTVTVNK